MALSLWPLIGHPLRLLNDGEGPSRFMCAAPPPTLDLTGEHQLFSHSFA